MSAAASPAQRAYLAKSRDRYRIACLAFALSFLAIALRLVSLGFAAVEPGVGGLHDISTTVHRPDILDRNGRLLATDIKGATLYADPAKVIDRDELVEQVASVLPDVNTGELLEKLNLGTSLTFIDNFAYTPPATTVTSGGTNLGTVPYSANNTNLRESSW